MKRNRVTRMVNFADCDPARIVFYPRFYEWFDRGTEMLFRSVGLHWEKMMDEDTGDGPFSGVPLVETGAVYRSPTRFGDEIEIESWIDTIGGKTFTVLHHIHNAGNLAVEGREVRVWAVTDTSRPAGIRAIPIPDHVRKLFEA